MAVRDALLWVTPRPRKAAEPKSGSGKGESAKGDSAKGDSAKGTGKGTGKSVTSKNGSGATDTAKARTAKTRTGKTGTGNTRTGNTRTDKAGTDKTRTPKARTPRTRTPKAAPTAPRPPVLQRRSLGPTLARAAVMALALVGMVAFAVALAKVTLEPSPASVDLIHTNLRPGSSIRAYLDQPDVRDTVKQIGGNILLGVPFGILLPMLFPNARGLVRVLLLTALVMVVVETAQGLIVEGRAFDIDDVILNTTGALLGYLLLGRRLGRALHPRRVHWWHRLGFGDPPVAAGETTTGARTDTAARTDTGGRTGTRIRTAIRPGRRPVRKPR